MAILTLFACCFGKSKCFRVFIFIVNIVRAIGSVFFYIVFSVFVFNIKNWPRKACLTQGVETDTHQIEMPNGDVYDDLEDCIESIRGWYIFGIVFFFVFAIPAMIVYCEIFYFWMRDPALADKKTRKMTSSRTTTTSSRPESTLISVGTPLVSIRSESYS